MWKKGLHAKKSERLAGLPQLLRRTLLSYHINHIGRATCSKCGLRTRPLSLYGIAARLLQANDLAKRLYACYGRSSGLVMRLTAQLEVIPKGLLLSVARSLMRHDDGTSAGVRQIVVHAYRMVDSIPHA